MGLPAPWPGGVRVGDRGTLAVLIDRDNWRPHLPWVVASLAVTALSVLWFVAACLGQADWPGGSSAPGFTFGVAGGVICLFEFLLWPRKSWFRAWRLGRTMTWMRAHIWLGLLAVPLLVLHTGFRWGGPLSAILMGLFLVVVASGVWGLVMQQFLPRRMLENIPAETIYSQIDHVAANLAEEAERLVQATCGPERGGNGTAVPGPAEKKEPAGAGYLVVGAVRTAGGVQGKTLLTRAPSAAVPRSEPLRSFFREAVKPFLLTGRRTGSPLGVAPRAAGMFRDLRQRLDPAAHETVAVLEDLCEQRRQLDQQARLHFWMHNWLCVHLPLSVALIALLFVHVYVALKYW